jgi:hypothetical protein
MSELRRSGLSAPAALSDTLGVLSTGRLATKGATVTREDDLYWIESRVLIDQSHRAHAREAPAPRGSV